MTGERQNSLPAFSKSFELGFGVETDLRDHNAEIVISHDMPVESTTLCKLTDLLDLYKDNNLGLPLALNVKADGMSNKVNAILSSYQITNYFMFDMSIPDTIPYRNLGMKFYTRQSEYEPQPAFYKSAAGVWLDAFEGDWIDEQVLLQHAAHGKSICIVSSELHGRPQLEQWGRIRKFASTYPDLNIAICTDFPTQARSFFNDKN